MPQKQKSHEALWFSLKENTSLRGLSESDGKLPRFRDLPDQVGYGRSGVHGFCHEIWGALYRELISVSSMEQTGKAFVYDALFYSSSGKSVPQLKNWSWI